MKKQIYTVGTVALALVMSGLPVVALAEGGEGHEGVNIAAQVVGSDASSTITAQVGKPSISGGEEESEGAQAQEQERTTLNASSSRPSIRGG